jgi:hypothetical protein
MHLSSKKSEFRKRESGFLSPSLKASRLNHRKKQGGLLETDSKVTLIDNGSISHSFNSSILCMNLRKKSYKRAESELKQIFRPNDSAIDPVKLNKQPKSLSKSIKLAKIFRRKKIKTDSSLSPKEADLILDEHRSVSRTALWKTILRSYQENPKQMMDLIPVSVKYSRQIAGTPKGVIKKKLSNSPDLSKFERKQSPKVAYERHFTFKSRSPSPIQMENVETLKVQTNKITSDWSRSLLYYNVCKRIGIETMGIYSADELDGYLKRLPSDEMELKEVHKKALITLEALLMELLGTHQDFVKFQEAYKAGIPSVIRILINNCIKLLRLRMTTSDILSKIIKREKMLEQISVASKKEIIEIYKISKEIRLKINNWLKEESVPFTTFTFKSKDYLLKMNEDLLIIQPILYRTTRKPTSSTIAA